MLTDQYEYPLIIVNEVKNNPINQSWLSKNYMCVLICHLLGTGFLWQLNQEEGHQWSISFKIQMVTWKCILIYSEKQKPCWSTNGQQHNLHNYCTHSDEAVYLGLSEKVNTFMAKVYFQTSQVLKCVECDSKKGNTMYWNMNTYHYIMCVT